jgi:hypothetical protein
VAKWLTKPPPNNGVFDKDYPDRYAIMAPRTNAQGYPEYDPTNVVFVGTHNECFVYLHKHNNHSIDYALKHGGWCWLTWTETRFPGFQRMISHMRREQVELHYVRCLAYYEVALDECELKEVQDTNSFDQSKGFFTKYELHWRTYRGWKVYMLMTGCFASIPEYEP